MLRSKIQIGVLGVSAVIVRGPLFQLNAVRASKFLGQQIGVFPITKNHNLCDAVLYSDHYVHQKPKKCPSVTIHIDGRSSEEIYDELFEAIVKVCQDYLFSILA